jgi:dTDP-4-amino-4,6-dideoxygalactose transaminase
MNRIPFQDLGRLHNSIRAELDGAFDSILRTSRFVGGNPVIAFEQEFAAAHGLTHGVGCASGTDALALTLRGLGIGPGDDVIVPSMTFVATAEAVRHVGATPVIADVDNDSLLLTTLTVETVRTDRTRAVIPVHLYGHVVPFDALRTWRQDGLLVVEDAAQAHLATWKDMPIGSVGHAACFSFYPGKNLGGLGDGGMVLTDDEDLVEKIRSLRDHGRSSKYVHDEIGYCSRLDSLQAAFLSVKLAHLAEWTEARRGLASLYETFLEHERLVPWEPGAVHHLLVVRTREETRASVQRHLTARGIETGVHYPITLSQQPSITFWAGPTPVAEAAAGQVLSLPMDPLMTEREVEQICEAVVAATPQDDHVR